MSRMEREIGTLRRRYRELRAPDHLAGRITARVRDDEGPGRRTVLPGAALAALAGVVAAAALLMALPWPDGGEADAAGIRPTSLTVLSLAAKSRPEGPVPGLSSLRGMTLPPPPSRPADDPETATPNGHELEHLRNHSRTDEEKAHANS